MLRFEEKGRWASKASHAGIIRIGFEGISQPHFAWSTPVSILRLKHLGPGQRKSAARAEETSAMKRHDSCQPGAMAS
jgi:hypothetical protein